MAKSAAPARYWARRPLTYLGVELDRGQVLALKGGPNDERLVRLGYVAELDPHAELVTCADCGAEFVGISERTGHGEARHRPQRPRDPREDDAAAAREERLLEEIAPLYHERAAGRR